tara:strand:+ start:316 stop:597 length:282 start_codon:yes stop_codon:yes gene_type:complete
MNEEKIITERELHTNEVLAMPVQPDSVLKEYLVQYVGEKFDQEEVTVHMVAETLAVDFPEFLYAFAEENFLRGYQQGLDDATSLHTSAPPTAS